MSGPMYPRVGVVLSGTDGNAFALIGRVAKALRAEVGEPEASAFVDRATACASYGALLTECMRTVEVS